MASSDSLTFRNESPALWFGPRSHGKPGPRNERLWLLWPAWAWRVAVPTVSTRETNVFQRTALALAAAGVRDRVEVGARMGIHPDLAGLVLQELFSMGLVDARGAPSSRGLSRLEDGAEAARSLTATWVFQDPFTRELWPRAENQLRYIERRFHAEGVPELVLGDAAHPWHQRAVLVRPRDVVRPAAPSPDEVLRAIVSQRKARRRLSREEDLDLSDDGEPEVEHEAVPSGGVSFIDDQPVATWLVAFAYFPRGTEGDNRWYVTDPFGLGPSERFRTWLERQRARLPFLSEAFRRFLRGRAEEDESTAHELATVEVEDRYGVGFRAHPAFEPLVDLHTALAAGERLTTFAARGAYGALRRALEETFLPLANGSPWRDLNPGDPTFNRQHIARCAEEAGLRVPPPAVIKVTQGQVRSAADYGGGSLRARMAAALLCAARHPGHPLRRAASTDPDILDRVDALADAAGGAVHSRRFRLRRDDLDADVVSLHDILRALGAGAQQPDEKAPSNV